MSRIPKPDESGRTGRILNEPEPADYNDEVTDEYREHLVKSVESIKPKKWDYESEPAW